MQWKNMLSNTWRGVFFAFLTMCVLLSTVALKHENSPPWHYLLLTALTIIASITILKICTFIRVHDQMLVFGMVPLITRKVPLSEVAEIDIETLPREQVINREWGAKGKAKAKDGFFMDVNGSQEAFVIRTTTGKLYKVGIGASRDSAESFLQKLRSHLNS